MKSSTTNTSASSPVKSSFPQEENLWPMRIGWVAIILLLVIILSAAIIFNLPGGREATAGTEALPPELATGLEQGTLLFEQGQLDAAEQLYRQLISDFPTHPQGYNNLAALYALRGDLDQAKSLLEKAMATDAEYTAIYRNLGTIYAELARDSYGRALQLEPTELRTQLQILDTQGTAQLVAAESQPATVEPPPEPAPATSTVASAEPISAPQAEQAAAEVPVLVTAEMAAPPEPVVAEAAPAPVTADASVASEVTAIESTRVAEKQEELTALAVETVAAQAAVPAPQPETPQQFIERWAAAWSAQDPEGYFSFYAEDYNPRSHKNKDAWMKKRQSRIVRPAFIDITLADIVVLSRTAERAEIELIQSYRNDRFQDRTRKRFELERQDQGWAIIREISLGSVN